MTPIRCETEPIGTRVLVRIAGELVVMSAPRVRMALLKSLVEQPDAVVVDLSGMTVGEPAAALVFLAVLRQAALWPGTPLLLAAARPEVAALLCPGRPAMFETVAAALSADARHRNPAVSDTLLPASGAARRARQLAGGACAGWGLPHLVAPAEVIAGEFVTNAVVHARTMIGLKISLGRRYVTVAVRDGSTAVPVPPDRVAIDPQAPRGLVLVEALAARWGSLPAADGKVVWATLRKGETP